MRATTSTAGRESDAADSRACRSHHRRWRFDRRDLGAPGDARTRYPTLVPIRDESCSLQRSPGPIARGRNVAIAAASSDVIACADAGCTYTPDWLANLTAPIFTGESEYSVGGSYYPTNADRQDDPPYGTLLRRPSFGVKLNPDAATKSCTARSMAFRKELWRRVGGFPEIFFLGEDTLFDAKARKLVTPAFAKRAKACLPAAPHTGLGAATNGQLFRSVRRFGRALGPPVAEPGALPRRDSRRSCSHLLAHSAVVGACTRNLFCLQVGLDRSTKGSDANVGARLIFSLIVPWVAAWSQIAGSITKKNRPNRQNFS